MGGNFTGALAYADNNTLLFQSMSGLRTLSIVCEEYRPISLLCPAAKVLESLILPTINKFLQPAPDEHGFRPDHSTTSSLLQLTTDIAMRFNQGKPPDRTICVAVYLSTAFDIVCHNNLLSKINKSQPPLATARWLSCDLRRSQTIFFLLQRCIVNV